MIPVACYARFEALPPPPVLNIEEEVGLRFPLGPPWCRPFLVEAAAKAPFFELCI